MKTTVKQIAEQLNVDARGFVVTDFRAQTGDSHTAPALVIQLTDADTGTRRSIVIEIPPGGYVMTESRRYDFLLPGRECNGDGGGEND